MAQPDFETLLRDVIGLDTASIGSKAVERAVQLRRLECHLPDNQAYWVHLQTSPGEMQALIEAVVVPETWFFRDREAFAALVRLAQEEWLPAHPAGSMRVLSLPCSTGEEPYSMAMALLDARLPPERFRIDAVDISARVLAVADRAVYGRNSFRGANLDYRDRHFSTVTEGMRVNDAVRRQVRFQQGNLFAPGFRPGLDNYDAIFCRNLLIYFDRATQDSAVRFLQALLTPEGMLFVGPSEGGLLLDHDFVSARLPLAFAFRRAPPAPAPKPPLRVAKPPATPRRPRVAQFLPSAPPPPVPAAPPEDDIAEAARLADQGRLPEAALLCEKHIRARGGSARAFCLMGLIRDAEGRLQDAAQYYRKALYLDSAHADAISHLALLLDKQGEAAAARRLRERGRRAATDANTA